MFCRKVFVLVLIVSTFVYPMFSAAGELVSGRYNELGRDQVKVELAIGAPAPASIILVQNLPKGVKVTSSDPELKNYSPAKGKAKWLLSKVKAGKMVVSITCDRPITKGEISGEIRYRDANGKMVNVPLSK